MTTNTETLRAVLPGRAGNGSNLALRLCRAVATRCALLSLLAVSFAGPARAASTSAEESPRLLAQIEPRIKAIYEKNEFAMRAFRATWLPDGSGYLRLEMPAGASGAEIVRYDSAGGNRTVVVASEKLLVPATSQRLRIREFVRSPSGNRFLLHTDTTNGGRGSDHWLYEPESGALRPVAAGAQGGGLLSITGSGETNTHIEIVEGLVDRLIALALPSHPKRPNAE